MNFIGTGLIFPIQIDGNGSPVYATGFPLLNSSIKIVLGWMLRSRIFLSSFGSVLDSLLEEPNDDLLKGMAEYFIFESLSKWEKRIEITDVKVNRIQPQRLEVEIMYKIRSSGLEEVLTYPFYKIINT